MKKTIYLLIAIIFIGCKSKFNYYQGYVYNGSSKPILNLTIHGRDNFNDNSLTDEKGFFKIKKTENWVETFLYIKKGNNLIDSIQVLRTHPEFGARYYFTDKRNDTIFITTK